MPRRSRSWTRKVRAPKVVNLSTNGDQQVQALTVEYAERELCGWVGVELAREHFNLMGADLAPFRISNSQGDYHGKRQMLWEFTRKVLGKDTENYAQAIGDCHDVNTDVLMSSGKWKPIADVRVGDYVVTHLSNHKRVSRTINKKYNGRLYSLKAKRCYKSITSTSDHEFISYSDDDLKRGEWKSISSLDVDNDSILIPFTFQEVEYEYLYYYGKRIKVDEDLAFVIGWYLAEGGISNRVLLDGSTSYQKVTFNLCIDEDNIADLLIEKLNSIFGVGARKQYNKEHKHVLLLEVYDVDFSTFLHKLVPDNLYDKKIPSSFFKSPRDVKIALLKAWIGGDGHITPSSAAGCSASCDLIRDFFHLSISCGLNPSVSYIPQQKHQTISSGLITFRNNSFREIIGRELVDRDYMCQKCVRARHTRNNNLGQLREIEYINYEEVKSTDVYCLEVEDDHSFIANGYAVHNCVSFSGKNVMEYLQCVQVALAGVPAQFKNMFPPYFYGSSRVFIGGGQISGDGSSGTWLQAAIKQYGALATDEPDVPQYSGSLARQWGSGQGPPQEFIGVAKEHLVKTTAQVQNADEAANALFNGYPISVCSDWGYNMLAGTDGFHAPKGTWGHAMTLTGFDDSDASKGLYFIILNSWGDVHGHLKDFTTGVELPVGILRVRAEYVGKMLAEGDSYAYSQFDGFPDNSEQLEKSLFDLVGAYRVL